mgnify:CR=1 FL=1
MIDYLTAIKRIYQSSESLNSEIVALNRSADKVCASAIFSSIETPSFNNSAMDGFAIRYQDIQSSSINKTTLLHVIGQIKAGDSAICTKQKVQNTACAIMTGAALPSDYDTVIRIEDVEQEYINGQAVISINNKLKPGQNVRYSGEDFRVGDIVISPGEVIRPAQIMALASIGTTHVQVRKTPHVSLFCTGDELLQDNTSCLSHSKIFNCSGPYISSLLPHFNSQLCHYEIVSDNKADFLIHLEQQLKSASPPDIILTTGGVSAGNFDFIPNALKEAGAKIIFHKVAIRPGKPILFAKIDQSYIIGLPGNPVSTAVGLRFFLYPLLRKISTMTEEQPNQAILANSITTNGKLRYFYKAVIRINNTGQSVVEILSGQESFKIKPLLTANCWAVLKEGKSSYRSGDVIDTFPLYPNTNKD